MDLAIRTDFNYSMVDFETQDFLKERANIIYGIQSRSAYDIGNQLVKAKVLLAKNGYGCFEEWYKSLGFKKTKAYEYINHFNFVCSQNEQSNIETFEDLPKSLQAQMSKPSANPKVNKAVFDGDVTTLKEYKELERKLKLSQADNQKLYEEKEKLAEQILNQKPIEKEVVVEKIPDDYQILKNRNKELSKKLDNVKWELDSANLELSTLKLESKQAVEIADKVRYLEGKKNKLETLILGVTELSSITSELEDFFDKKMAPLRFKALINSVNAHYSIKEVKKMVDTVQFWCDEMYKIIPEGNRKMAEEVIIDD